MHSDVAAENTKEWFYIQSDYGQNVLDFLESTLQLQQFTSGNFFDEKYLLTCSTVLRCSLFIPSIKRSFSKEKNLSCGVGMVKDS